MRTGVIYSPEASDDYPPWKCHAINALGVGIAVLVLGMVVAALWALFTHLWVVPILAAPILIWAFVSTITHP